MSEPAETDVSLRNLAFVFLKLGFLGFGGPAAHISMMEEEVVERRGWIDRQHFLDLIGAINLIPGPNSTEMALHVGFQLRGGPGILTTGTCFIGPAVAITGTVAWLYVSYGDLPRVEPFLYGIKPAVLAVIFGAMWRLGRTAVKNTELAFTGAAVAGLSLYGLNEILALLFGGCAGTAVLLLRGRTDANGASPDVSAILPWAASGSLVGGPTAPAAGTASLMKLGWFFFKVGSILYGSGYVLVAFLESDLVEGYGWLTRTQLLDAIAFGQFTPGPVLSTSTFIGYVLSGWSGALVATACIFAPAFVFVMLLNPLVPRLRESRWSAAFMDAVNVSAVGLIGAVTARLAAGSLVDWPGWTIGLVSAVAGLYFNLHAAWLVLGGALLGWLLI